jgi:GT2 family glycosyltransferase
MDETVEATTRAAVIVPTHNRPRSLARCLDALDRQHELADLEVIVVDDGSSDAPAVAAVVGLSRRARLVRCDQARGPAAARNRGAGETRAPILLFTDDDCEPAPDWAATMSAALSEGSEVVAGISANGNPRNRVASASETILEYVQDRARGRDLTTSFAATNNLGCTARVLAQIPFDERYRYGEDRDWCARVRAAGYAVRVLPAARIAHRQELHLSSFLRQQFGYGRGAYLYRHRHAALGSFEAPSFYAGLLRRGFSHSVVTGVLVGVAQAATAAGFVREALSRRR